MRAWEFVHREDMLSLWREYQLASDEDSLEILRILRQLYQEEV